MEEVIEEEVMKDDDVTEQEEAAEEDAAEEEEEESVGEDNEDIVESDELTGDYTVCNEGFSNPNRLSPDIENPVNVGDIDDRTCYSNYSEVDYNGKTWGMYNITDGSNHLDGTRLQPRMERALRRVNGSAIGSFIKFNGTVRILEVGDHENEFLDGTYFMQVKGQHEGNTVGDPAICLYLAKPVIENGKQVSFDIYREQIKYRLGSGKDGRDLIFLTNVKKNQEVEVQLVGGFRMENGEKVHYADAIIDGKVFNWNIPEPERGTQTKIRYGAYRVKAGRAQIRWADTTFERLVNN